MQATGVGSMPGDDSAAYAEAVRQVLGVLAAPVGVPMVPEMPGRGAIASMTGRSLALSGEVAADLQPAGWRLTAAPGIDQRRARSLVAQDLDQVEEQAQGFTGAFKTQVAGPWTLAATVERPRGDKVLADHGARRDLAQALAHGLGDHLADLRRRVPGATEWLVQVDEPALSAVLQAKVPTASGFGRHRAVDLPEASTALSWVFAAITEAGGHPWVHSCAAGTPWDLLIGAGAAGLSVDLEVLTAADHDRLGEAIEQGVRVALGLVPTSDPATPRSSAWVAERVERWLDMLGLDLDEVGDRVVVAPACGLAGASPTWARRALELCAEAAKQLT